MMWREEPHGSTERIRVLVARVGPYVLAINEDGDGPVPWRVGEGERGERSTVAGVAPDVTAAKRAAIAEVRRRLNRSFDVYDELAGTTPPPRWGRHEIDGLGSLRRAVVGPFTLVARTGSYVVYGAGWAASGAVPSIERAQAGAIRMLRGRLLTLAESTVEGFFVRDLVAEVETLDRETSGVSRIDEKQREP